MISFISVIFLVFVALTLLLYFAVPLKWRWIVLLVASLIFYGYAGLDKLPFVLGTCLVAYIITHKIEKIYNSGNSDKKEEKKAAKRWLILGVMLIILLLLYTKIGYLVYEALDSIFLFDFDLKVIVPLGISYYTFSIIGYMADVYWKKETTEHNYFKLLLFMIYFPQILQGPIARHKKLMDQITGGGYEFDYKNMCYGLQRAVWGYFKKMVIADRLAMLTSEVFGNYIKYEGLYFVVAAIAAAIELYCDFSGCMDIALGISEAMSIKLDENFNRPFYSKSAAEFWRRWHITLGMWFKDYIYMPIVINPRLIKFSQKAGRRFGKRFTKSIMTAIPLAIVWLLTGLWHSTGLNYVVWGCYWGLIIIISTVFAPEFKKLSKLLKINVESKYWQTFQIVRTFCLFLVSRLLTVPGNLTETFYIVRQMLSKFNIWILFDKSLYNIGLDRQDFWVGIFAIILLWKVSSIQEKGICVRDKIAALPLVFRWAVYYAGILAILIFGIYGSGHSGTTFIYMQY